MQLGNRGAFSAAIDAAYSSLYMVGRVVMHGERRAREMEEVAETLGPAGGGADYGGGHSAADGLERADGQ